MRLSAVDSIQHGLLNLRANWELVIALFVQTIVVTVIAIVGLLPLVFALGFSFLRSTFGNLDGVDGAEGGTGAAPPERDIGKLVAATLKWRDA